MKVARLTVARIVRFVILSGLASHIASSLYVVPSVSASIGFPEGARLLPGADRLREDAVRI